MREACAVLHSTYPQVLHCSCAAEIVGFTYQEDMECSLQF